LLIVGGMATRAYLEPQQQPRASAALSSFDFPTASPPRELERRALNVAVAAIGIILTAPLMLVIAALVKLTSRGPVLYTQPRVGIDRRARRVRDRKDTRDRNLGGAPFTIYKFRTMRVAHEAAQVWARQGDSRVTPVGAVLRKYRLDELPQLFNVLRGDMNVVGPRPEQPEIFGQLRERIVNYPWRQRVLPGITGWAQVNLCYDQTIDDVRRKVAYDLAYIRRASAVEDLRIMMRTLPVMLGRRLGW
jgi:lipopolysaccharide/colanic/teichoic acid biosynthesis glycosyltransferase